MRVGWEDGRVPPSSLIPAPTATQEPFNRSRRPPVTSGLSHSADAANPYGCSLCHCARSRDGAFPSLDTHEDARASPAHAASTGYRAGTARSAREVDVESKREGVGKGSLNCSASCSASRRCGAHGNRRARARRWPPLPAPLRGARRTAHSADPCISLPNCRSRAVFRFYGTPYAPVAATGRRRGPCEDRSQGSRALFEFCIDGLACACALPL